MIKQTPTFTPRNGESDRRTAKFSFKTVGVLLQLMHHNCAQQKNMDLSAYKL
jgi:hypothetical protein